MTRRAAPAMLLSAAVVMAGLLAAAGEVGAQGFGKNKVQTRAHDWRVLYTPHFEIHHYEGAEELAVRASLIAEQAYREYADRLDHELTRRVPFILYASHNDFAQTNIADDLIGEGTGGFSEPYRNRMVLPYNGSHEEFVHVIRHELVHVFMFDAAFGSSRAATARSPFFRIPLWYAEGIAEWLSSGWDANADMFVRDATINDYLLPLDMVGGYQVYKQGQAAMRLLSERYGEEKLVELWRRVGRSRSVEAALRQTLGLKMKDLDELYAKQLRKRYWPSYADLEEAADIARPLTDHVRGQGLFNARPALSPDGDQLAFLSDRDGLISLYLMSALDGKVLRRLAQGQRSSRFESLHGYSSSLSFDPSGREVAFLARSGNEERLLTVEIATGNVSRSLPLGLDGAASPAWSPDGRRLALVGTRNGRTDLWLLDLVPGLAAPAGAAGPSVPLADGLVMTRLTDDVGDEGPPAWSPDGRRLAFAFNPRAELDFEFELDAAGERRLLWARPREAGGDSVGVGGGSIVLLDPTTGARHALWAGPGGRRDPVWIDGGTLCVVDESEGIANLAVVELDAEGVAVARERRLTNVLGGLFQPTYAPAADRLVFTAFHAGGYDLYAADGFRDGFARRSPPGAPPRAVTQELPPLVLRKSPPDSVADAERVGSIRPYRPRLAIEPSGGFGGGGVYYNSAVGLGVANVITLSDLMGDNRLSLLLNLYGSISNSDLAATYTYLRRRVNLGVGIFHYKNYYSSVFTTVGELLPTDTFFSERNYGLFGIASYPLSTFRRFDLQFEVFRSERTLYAPDFTGFYLVPYDQRTVTLAQPSLSYVYDSAYFGPYGPVTGSRVLLTFAPSLPLSGDALDRRTAVADVRRYWMPARRNTFALRAVGAVSEGRDPRAFVLGGPWTLRGHNVYDFETVSKLSGSRMFLVSAEYRLPLLDYVIFGWPGRWGLSGFGATLFCDVGAAWNGRLRMFGDDEQGRWAFRDLRGDYGLGLRTRLLSLPVRLDWAWKTNLRRSQDPVFHFSIGPEFYDVELLLAELNPAQREAVETTNGPVLVVAGAGSGKTRVLTTRVAWALARDGATPGEILAFTFTNRAAREMRERVERLVGPGQAPRWLGTFHATGARLLRIDGVAIGVRPDFSIYDTEDSLRVVKRAVERAHIDTQTLPPTAIRSRLSRWKNDGTTPAEARAQAVDLREERCAEVYAVYEQEIRRNNALDFDDLILRTVQLLAPGSPVQQKWARRFRHVLVDEFQDTNRLQMVLVKSLAQFHGNVFVVGDDDQSIYGWRGACLENMLEFEQVFPGTRLIRLEQNYRSTGNILAAANAVIAHNRRRKGKTLWTAGEAGDPIRLDHVFDEEDEAARVVEIVREQASEGAARGDVTVLYRTNAQSRALEDALRRAVVPYQIVGGTQFYERREVRDLLAYLKLIANPRDAVAAARVLNVPRRKLGDTTAARLRELADKADLTLAEAAARPELLADALPAAACRRVRAFFAQVDDWRAAAATLPVPALLERVVAETGYREWLEKDDPETAEARLENVAELVNAAHAFAEATDDGRLAGFLEQTALVADADSLTDGEGVVRLMTIHTAKGLEFPVVVLAGCEEGLLPHANSAADDRGLEEERRLFYVALTRARRRVYLLHARARRRAGQRELGSPSRFLAEIPDTLLEQGGEQFDVRRPGLDDLLGRARDGGGRSLSLWPASGSPSPPARGPAAIPAGGPVRRASPGGNRGALGGPVSGWSEPAGLELVWLAPGRGVVHPTLGPGIVVRVEGEGDDLLVTIDFPAHGRRHLLASHAHLRPNT